MFVWNLTSRLHILIQFGSAYFDIIRFKIWRPISMHFAVLLHENINIGVTAYLVIG